MKSPNFSQTKITQILLFPPIQTIQIKSNIILGAKFKPSTLVHPFLNLNLSVSYLFINSTIHTLNNFPYEFFHHFFFFGFCHFSGHSFSYQLINLFATLPFLQYMSYLLLFIFLTLLQVIKYIYYSSRGRMHRFCLLLLCMCRIKSLPTGSIMFTFWRSRIFFYVSVYVIFWNPFCGVQFSFLSSFWRSPFYIYTFNKDAPLSLSLNLLLIRFYRINF